MSNPPSVEPDFPTANVRTNSPVIRLFSRATLWVWLLAGLCLVTALVLTYRATRSVGLTITVQFEDGHGLKPDDTVRYRGIDVGHVIAVRLRDDRDG